MSEDQHQFLSLLGQLPARLTVEQAAWVLNCQPHDVPVLIAARLVKPLGNPPANGIKFFSTAEVLESTMNRHWLMKVTATINQHWQKKNQRKKRPDLVDVLAGEHPTRCDNGDAS
jgi:hypothetical protein